ncbi:hypothetical protein VPH35_123450 [Triticum aestivum]
MASDSCCPVHALPERLRLSQAPLPLLLRWRVPPRQVPLLPLRTSLPKPQDLAAKPSRSAMASLSSACPGASSRHSSLQIRPASARSPVPSRIPRPMDSQLRRPVRRSPHCRPLLPLHREAVVQAEKDERLDPPAMSPHLPCACTARIDAAGKPLPPCSLCPTSLPRLVTALLPCPAAPNCCVPLLRQSEHERRQAALTLSIEPSRPAQRAPAGLSLSADWGLAQW